MTVRLLLAVLQAIPAVYSGVTYRSRLEARWAVFFDTLSIKFYYEYEGYQLDCGWYLPDFWLPEHDCFVEIKPQDASRHEQSLCDDLHIATGKNVYLLCGNVEITDANSFADKNFAYGFIGRCGGCDLPFLWCECPKCGRIGIAFDGRAELMGGHRCSLHEKEYAHDTPRLREAYLAAQRYRFW